MENQNEQLSLFTEHAFEPRDIEQVENKKPEFDLDLSHVFESQIGFDCFYYLAAGSCVLHGDTTHCINCDDYKSINDDDIKDEDLEDDD